MKKIKLDNVEVTQMTIGGNQFSGFSHRGPEGDREMMLYYTTPNIISALKKAEAAGINTFFGRSDNHIKRMLMEYWDQGGTLQWFAQTATELGDQLKAIRDAAALGAKGAYIHGGQVDYWYAQKQYDMLKAALDTMRECGVAAGFAGHNPDAHAWIRDNLDPDFQMCCYYDPTPRSDSPHHVSTPEEKWDPGHRDKIAGIIKTIPRTVVHYKIFAGGNMPIAEGFEYCVKQMRENDMVLIGYYLADNQNMIAENVKTFDQLVG